MIDEQLNTATWAEVNEIKLANGQMFSFKNREYQYEPMGLKAPAVCYMKGSGGGFSEIEILKTIHGMSTQRYPQGVAYYFPNDTVMQVYVKSRFNPLFKDNKFLSGIMKTGSVKSGKTSDAADFKRIGDANLFLRGANTQMSEANVIGIQVDRVVLDEIDQMDTDVIDKIMGRMGNAAVDGIVGKREIVYIANPSDEDRGIDVFWKKSDQRFWYRECKCGHNHCAEKEFPLCIGEYPNGRGFIACKKCGDPLPIAPGHWEADHHEVKDLVGYHWSHLTSVYYDPMDILRRFEDPPNDNLAAVMRFDLGRPFSSATDRLQKSTVFSCCGHDSQMLNHSGPCAMGVDVGKVKHVVIGIKTGNETYEILRVAQVKSFEEIHDLAIKYNVKSAVVDIRPYEDEARQFQKTERYKVFLCEYTESPVSEASFNENTGVVKSYRTGIFDATHRLFTNGNVVLPRQCPDIIEFAEQCCNTVKTPDDKKGQLVYRYQKIEGRNHQEEHYRNALNYFLLAARGHRINTVNKYKTKQRQLNADFNYARV